MSPTSKGSQNSNGSSLRFLGNSLGNSLTISQNSKGVYLSNFGEFVRESSFSNVGEFCRELPNEFPTKIERELPNEFPKIRKELKPRGLNLVNSSPGPHVGKGRLECIKFIKFIKFTKCIDRRLKFPPRSVIY